MTQSRFIAHLPQPPRAGRALLLAGLMLAMPLALSGAASAQALRYAPSQDSFSQDSFSQDSFAQDSFPQDSFRQDSFPRHSFPQHSFPQDYVTSGQDADEDGVLPERLRRAVVSFSSGEAPGTIIIDTGNTTLYYVLGQGRAIRYGVGVGREGFTWSGVQTITRKMVWPDWHPPAEMIARQPYLPRFMAGGRGNPLGARAMYLGSSAFRIHGTNDPTTIGKFVSSGCIRLTNDDVIDLADRIDVGTKVVVLAKTASLQARGTTAIRPTALRSRSLALPRSAGREAMNIDAAAVD